MDERQRRQNEIEAKRARLAELKRARELRTQERQTGRSSLGPGELAQPTPLSTADRQRDLDSLITSLVGESRASSTGPRLSGSPARLGNRTSRPSSTLGSRQLSPRRSESRPRVSDGSGVDQTGSQVRSSTPSESQYVTTATQTPGANDLKAMPVAEVIEAPIVPKRVIETYDHAVQCDESDLPPPPGKSASRRHDDATDGEEDSDGTDEQLSRRQKDRYEQIRQELRQEVEEEIRAALQPTSSTTTDGQADKFPMRTLNREELDAVTGSRDFMDFIDQSTKVIERALDEPYDLLTDYAEGNGAIDDEEDGFRGRRGRRVKEVAQFWDERWSKRRMIGDLSFSPKHPELLLAAYTKNSSAPHEPDGLIQIWNAHMPSRPEYIFHASSDILTAKFSPFHPSLIIGGCYSGQILIWDTRTKPHTAVQKTPLTGQGHTHPVYNIDVVGTQNANNIISCSTDGVVCSWSVDMLAASPQEYLELAAPPPSKTDDLAPISVAFPQSDPTYFIAGTEEGAIFTCHRYERAGAKAGVDVRVRYTGHTAPVTSLDFHPAHGYVDLGDLVLSTAMDWSAKLWRIKPPAATGGSATGNPTMLAPTLDFPRDDLVYDAKWSPVRPSVFALVDGAGALEVWDVNADVEVPMAKVTPSERAGSNLGWAKRSLNKCAWERTEGKRIAVGGLDGVVTVFEVGNELGGKENVKAEEWTTMKKVIGRAEARVGARGVINGGAR